MKNLSTTKKVLIGLGILLLIIIIVSPSQPKVGKKINSEIKTEEPTKESIINVTAKDLYKDYNANEVAADDKYKGKTIAVTGSIESINKDIMDEPYVVINSGQEFMGVQCGFEDSKQAAKFSKCQKVTLQGECTGSTLGSPMLKNCILVQ